MYVAFILIHGIVSAPKLELLAVQWLHSNLCKVDSYVAIGVIQSKVAVLYHP